MNGAAEHLVSIKARIVAHTLPDTQVLVINTAPLIALVAALGDLSILRMYDRVWVPREVCQEMLVEG